MTTEPDPTPDYPPWPPPSDAYLAKGRLTIGDTSRDVVEDPCPDCRRTYIVGESVVMWAATPEPGVQRKVWAGCIDCWLTRTQPRPEAAE